MKEIISITSHPTFKTTMDETNKIITDVSQFNIDLMYSSHYHNIPKSAIKNCKYIIIDKNNPILGFNTEKKYDYVLKPMQMSTNKVFENTEVNISNSFAHYLLLKNSIQFAKMKKYDYFYTSVFDVYNFFNFANKKNCFDSMRNHIHDHDAVVFLMKKMSMRKGNSYINPIDTKVFAINLKSKLVETFFNEYETVEDWAKLHVKWNPFLKKYFNVNSTFYVCDFLELIFTLEFNNYKVKILEQELEDGKSGFFESLVVDEEKELTRRNKNPYSHDIEECRKKLNVIRT